jgi:hypothetical protein
VSVDGSSELLRKLSGWVTGQSWVAMESGDGDGGEVACAVEGEAEPHTFI